MDDKRKIPESIKRKKRRRPNGNRNNPNRNIDDKTQTKARKNMDYETQDRARNPIEGKKNRRPKLSNKDRILNNIKKMPIGKKILMGISIVIALFLVSLVISVIMFFGQIKNNSSVTANNPGFNDPVNILVLGMDIGSVSDEDNEAIKRTDTMMLINYNPSTRNTQIVSIPRDTLINENGKNYKINAAYVKGGDAKVKQVVENLLSVNVNYVVKIDYGAFRDFIDSIGGVNMGISRDMIYDDDGQNLHINFKSGTTEHLNGKKAEEFFRWRKNNDGTGFPTGDLGRIENQHLFLQKVVEKCKSPLILFRMPIILGTMGKDIDTNMKASSIIYNGFRLMLSKDGFQMKTIEGTAKMIGGQSYLVVDKEANKDLISSLKSSSAKSNSTSNAIDKNKTKIIVVNGTSINGLASQVKTDLVGNGWTNVDTGNCDTSEKSYIKTDNSELKKNMKDILKKINNTASKPNEDKYSAYDVVIIVGNDYKK